MKLFTRTSLTAVLILSLSAFLSAQTVNQGAWMVGGSASLDIAKAKGADESTTSFHLNPNLGYFISDDLAIGLGLNVDDEGIEGVDTRFGIGPFVRYYVADPIFIQANVNLELNEGGGTSFGAAVGYSWFVNSAVAIEPSLYFQSFNADLPFDAGDGSAFGLAIGIQAFAGRNE
jgi:hypothetical protein